MKKKKVRKFKEFRNKYIYQHRSLLLPKKKKEKKKEKEKIIKNRINYKVK